MLATNYKGREVNSSALSFCAKNIPHLGPNWRKKSKKNIAGGARTAIVRFGREKTLIVFWVCNFFLYIIFAGASVGEVLPGMYINTNGWGKDAYIGKCTKGQC